MKARTIPWESIADWYKENEQTIRDVMKFEGLCGAVNEVLRIAPEQPELAALREELAKEQLSCAALASGANLLKQRLTAAEQRNAARDIESAAKVLANCMDYPWEHMPENGRVLMRKHAKDVIDAALKPTESGASE